MRSAFFCAGAGIQDTPTLFLNGGSLSVPLHDQRSAVQRYRE